MRREVRELGDIIVRNNGGKYLYCFSEISNILNCGINQVPSILNEHGILVKRRGKKKCADAYDLAEIILAGRISPIDNTEGGQASWN